MSESQTERPASMIAGEDEEEPIIIGSEDFTNGWWSTFSDTFVMEGDGTIHFLFKNHSDGKQNYDNWVLYITSENERNDDANGYTEYLALRPDDAGWGTLWTNSLWEGPTTASVTRADCDDDWEGWLKDMMNASVDMYVTRSGNTITFNVVQTGIDSGKEWHYEGAVSGDLPDRINIFLLCEECYLELYPSSVWIGTEYTKGTNIVGSTDCSTGWWSAFSESYSIPAHPDYPFVVSFYNYTSKAATWDNWLLVGTSPFTERNGSGYSEYFVVRSDAYGWDGSGNNTNGADGSVIPADGGFTSSFDWDTFPSDMDGSYHQVGVIRNGSSVLMRDYGKKGDGSAFPDYTYEHPSNFTSIPSSDEMYIFFTCEAAYLDIVRAAYMPYFNEYEW